MNPIYTTHLICAPQLELPTIIGALLAAPGDFVEADDPLVLLYSSGIQHEVCAPEAGYVGYFTVNLNETIHSHDLLLTMEIEEKPIGFSPFMEEEPTHIPACKQAEPLKTSADTQKISSQKSMQVTNEAAELAAKLGVNIAEVNADEDGIVDEDAISAYVRDILLRWQKMQRLLKNT